MTDFGRELMRRRVPHIVGAYLAGGWILLEFTDWTVNRYVLSSHVTDFVVASWLLLLPAVAILAWNHGSPGKDRWSRADTIGIALNLVFAGVILSSVFRGQDLGAATSTVVVQDEEGKELRREIPKAEFRHRVALFSFANESGDRELDWLQYGLPKAISIDMAQDPFVRAEADIWREKDGGDPERPLLLPLAQRREIAGRMGAETFVTGAFDRVDAGIELQLTVHDTERGRPLAEHILTATDPLDLADQVSVRVRRDLDIPTGHLDATPDLPVDELLTSVEGALRPFFAGSFYQALDAGKSRSALEAAVGTDSTFARANALLGNLRFRSNELNGALEAYEAAIRHEYRLEESTRFALKTQYFYASRQPDRALSVARLRTELYPHDPEAHFDLGALLRARGEFEDAISAFETTIALDPSNQPAHLYVGDLHRDAGEFDRASEAYRALEQLDPRAARTHIRLGNLFLTEARLEDAVAKYERAQILDPSLISPSLGLGMVEMFQGDFEHAERRLSESMNRARSDADRIGVLQAQSQLMDMRGQPTRAADLARERAALEGQVGGRLGELEALGNVAVLKTRAGDTDGALALLDTLHAELEPPLDGLVDLIESQVYRELGNEEQLAAAIPGVRGLIESFGLGSFDWWGDLLEAEARRMSGSCEDALSLYRSASDAMPEPQLFFTIRELGTDPLTGQAACLRELGQYQEAETLVREVLRRIPAEPTAHLELARLEIAQGRPLEARRAVDAALVAWSDADPEFRPAVEARALREALSD